MSDSRNSSLADRFPLRSYEVERKQDTPWSERETVAQDYQKLTISQRFQVHVVDRRRCRMNTSEKHKSTYTLAQRSTAMASSSALYSKKYPMIPDV